RRHFGLDCFSSRRVFGHYLLALGAMITTGLVSGLMALLHVMRHMRLGLRRLNSLWRLGRGRRLGERHSAEAQKSSGGECECKLVHGYPPRDGTAKNTLRHR